MTDVRRHGVTLFAAAGSRTSAQSVETIPYPLSNWPENELRIADDWIVQPTDPWEVNGYVSNVVFTCGAIPEDDGTVKIYWGGADSVMCLGTAKIQDLVDRCLRSPRPPMGPG